MITGTEHSDKALIRAEPEHVQRHTGFALNQSKQVKNLVKDAAIKDFDTVYNNFNENINVKCSSGFYLWVATPVLLDLAKQACDTNLTISNINIQCTNNRISLDENNLHVNSTYFFELADSVTEALLGRVTVHCHVTTKVIQFQGSKLILGTKAPVWFF